MVVNTGTTIITFLMVFLLQNSRYRDNRALRAKLDELILAGTADNRFVGAEHLDVDELNRIGEQMIAVAGTRVDESSLDEGQTSA